MIFTMLTIIIALICIFYAINKEEKRREKDEKRGL